MSSVFRRTLAVLMSALAVAFIGGLPLVAQESAKDKANAQAKPARKAYDPTRRVPNHFGQLGLTSSQRETIYKIQAEHQPQIEALQKQIEQLRAKSLHECEAVLTDAQRKVLAERRASAAESRAKRRRAASHRSKK